VSIDTVQDPLASAREAFDRHAWREAFDRYREADVAGASLSPGDLDQLAQSAWWISRIDECMDARERSYQAYLDAGDTRRAAYEAMWVARDNFIRLRDSIGNGWYRRAERLLEDEPESVEHAYLEQMRASKAFGSGDLEATVEHAGKAVDLGARFGDKDIQARGLTAQGEALVAQGKVDEGMALYDEATMAAVGGELSPMATGIVYCNTIGICAEMADYRRAGEWTEAAKRWCERQAISGFPGVCRVHRAEVVRLRGAWVEAEREARVASAELTEHGVLNFAGAGWAEVGTIRLRMGDLDAAEEAFGHAHELGNDPQPSLALLRLERGDPAGALATIKRALDGAASALGRAKLLPAAVDISLAAGDLEVAKEAVDELDEIADRYQTPMLHASVAGGRGSVLLAKGDPAGAIESLGHAIRHWQAVEAPYEGARARETLGLAYRAAGEQEQARLELRTARSTFGKLGAVLDERRVAELLGEEAPEARRVRRTFMFTDIVGSTSLVEAIGDEAWEDIRRWHDQALRASFPAYGGREVDHAGDGFFVAFEDPGSAIECAAAIQRLLVEHRRTHGFAPRVRIGVHSSEATEAGGGYGGKGVHQAARIGSLAGEDEIVASEETLVAAGGRWAVSEPREEHLKGISEPVRVVTVAWN
jgi:class 3 adenylate cyclase